MEKIIGGKKIQLQIQNDKNSFTKFGPRLRIFIKPSLTMLSLVENFIPFNFYARASYEEL